MEKRQYMMLCIVSYMYISLFLIFKINVQLLIDMFAFNFYIKKNILH